LQIIKKLHEEKEKSEAITAYAKKPTPFKVVFPKPAAGGLSPQLPLNQRQKSNANRDHQPSAT
jgi:hypothetical protein